MEYDAIIIGCGPGGFECAMELKRMGKKIAVIEKEELGGTCTNWGCIPTKALLSGPRLLDHLSDRRDLEKNETQLDFEKSYKRKDRVVSLVRKGIEYSLKGIDIIKGQARIISQNKVRVDDKVYEAKNIVIATGSEPIKIFDSMTSRDILGLDNSPQSLAIIGGGIIGVEFASIFNSFGTKVRIIEALERIVSTLDKDISAFLEKELRKRGIEIIYGKADVRDGMVIIDEKEVKAEKILQAVGRKPRLPDSDIEIKKQRGILVDKHLRTNFHNIYAIGDCNDMVQLAHAASRQGYIAARNIIGDEKVYVDVIPSCVYSIPPAAGVGLLEEEVDGAIVKKAEYGANAYARCNDHRFGFLKIIADRNELVKGVHVAGENSDDLITIANIMIKNRMSLHEISQMVFPHPSISELFLEALKN